MVSAPHNFERRRSVRRDMLDLPSVRDGVILFRFLLGQVPPTSRLRWGSHAELQAEASHLPGSPSSPSDVLMLDTLDGHGPNK